MNDQVGSGKVEDVKLSSRNPFVKLGSFPTRLFCSLMSHVGSHVAIGDDDVVLRQQFLDVTFRLKPVGRVKRCGEERIHLVQLAELAVQKTTDCRSEVSLAVAGEADEGRCLSMRRQPLTKAARLELSAERQAAVAPAFDGILQLFDALDAVELGETPPTNSFDARWRDLP